MELDLLQYCYDDIMHTLTVAVLQLAPGPFTQPFNDVHYVDLIYTHKYLSSRLKEGSKNCEMCMLCIIHSNIHFVVICELCV